MRTLAAGWAVGSRPDVSVGAAWSPEEWQLYLQDLPRPMDVRDCRWLDETFNLTARGNYEVLVEWLTIAAASAYLPALPRVREVLSTIGRMKYLKPLYKALMLTPETAAFAREVFAQVSESYHPLSRASVAGIVGARWRCAGAPWRRRAGHLRTSDRAQHSRGATSGSPSWKLQVTMPSSPILPLVSTTRPGRTTLSSRVVVPASA